MLTNQVCRERCFGLPLYSAIAREALAERLGLLRPQCLLLAQSGHEPLHCTCPPLGVNRTSTAAIPFGKFYRAFECIIFTGPLSSREQGSEGATLKIGAVLAEVGELIRSTAPIPRPKRGWGQYPAMNYSCSGKCKAAARANSSNCCG